MLDALVDAVREAVGPYVEQVKLVLERIVPLLLPETFRALLATKNVKDDLSRCFFELLNSNTIKEDVQSLYVACETFQEGCFSVVLEFLANTVNVRIIPSIECNRIFLIIIARSG